MKKIMLYPGALIPIALVYFVIALGQIGPVVRPSEIASYELTPEDLKYLPTIDLRSATRETSKEASTAEELARRSRYDLFAAPKIYDPNSGTELEPPSSHLNRPNNPIPVSVSDVVAIGEVVTATGHLSANGTNAFSTFTFEPSTIVKATGGKPFAESVEIERSGAFVIFPSGHTRAYGAIGLGLPEVGGRYLFFLKRNAEQTGFQVVTGYLLPTTAS
jgi:hypothetical protein